ncbi:MAG: uncharacterized protein QOJ94_1746 [Sphingomonadales bacterium]|jgi:uncharacterized protein YggE|nr:uncharacterized protein [Sphingomonadales bacterium]
MKLHLIAPLLLVCAALPATPAAAQAEAALAPGATRLLVVATGEARRVPDIATIGAGVVTTAPTAAAALEQNSRQMAAVLAALKRAGIADRDIQTSSVSLFPDYRQDGTSPPQIMGYRASNEVSVRFRDIAATGRILDVLVAQGANQINGPSLGIENSDSAMDEARTKALAAARARAEIYARALGKRVTRVIEVSEGSDVSYPRPMMMARVAAQTNSLPIAPGEQGLSATLTVVFELD